MASANKTLPRIAGVLILVQSVIGFLINEVLAGPYTFAKDYLTVVSAHSFEVTIAMLLGVVDGAISISFAAMLLPIFKKQSEIAAYAFLAFSVLGFMVNAIDGANMQSLLTLSKEYVSAANPDAHYFQTMGAVAYATRLWTHLMTLLVACFPSAVFYYLLFSSRLVPRFISVWGFISVALMALAVLLIIFGQGTYMMLFLPMGLNQLVLVGWLIIKGFKNRELHINI